VNATSDGIGTREGKKRGLGSIEEGKGSKAHKAHQPWFNITCKNDNRGNRRGRKKSSLGEVQKRCWVNKNKPGSK